MQAARLALRRLHRTNVQLTSKRFMSRFPVGYLHGLRRHRALRACMTAYVVLCDDNDAHMLLALQALDTLTR